MARVWTAALLGMILTLSIAAVPALSQGPLPQVLKWNPDGSVEAVDAQLLDIAPPPLLGPGLTKQDPGTPAAPSVPDDAGLEKDKARATRLIEFYGHVFGAGMVPATNGEDFGPDGPQAANTIFPRGDGNLGLGFNDDCFDSLPPLLSPPLPLLGSAGNTGPCDTDPNNKLAFFLTAGPVQVHQRDDFVYSKLHNEHGRTKDVVLDKTQDITAGMWMTLDLHSWQVGNGDGTNCIVHLPPDVGCPYPYWGWDPAVWPGWVVEATLYTVELGEYGQGASEPPPIYEKWAAGDMEVVAKGSVGPKEVQNGIPGAENVYYYEVNLGKPAIDVIPKTKDIVMVFNFFSLVNGQKFATGNWRIWGGEKFPTKFTIPVRNPLDVELVIPQFVHDKLLIHSVISSAWGSYDVDVGSARLTVVDSANRPADMVTLQRVGDYQVAHGAHFKPVNITWIWDYKADKLRPGDYKVFVNACNLQHTACETTEAGFSIGADLLPTDVRVGRQGQRTVSEGQLAEITGGSPAAGGFGADDREGFALPLLLGQQGAMPRAMASGGDAPPAAVQAGSQDARAVPGVEPLLGAMLLAGVAIVMRRRGF